MMVFRSTWGADDGGLAEPLRRGPGGRSLLAKYSCRMRALVIRETYARQEETGGDGRQDERRAALAQRRPRAGCRETPASGG